MGSQAVQAQLWGRSPRAWSSIQEATGQSGYDHALQLLQLKTTDTLLDVGCGAGLFCSQALQYTPHVTGLDATPALLHVAQQRAPQASFLAGEMEALPFADSTFDVVTGFNAFQYAANVHNALAEACRVLQPGGKLIAMIWGNKAACEAAAYLAAVGSLLPPPPPGTPGPFALSENQRLEQAMQAAGFNILHNSDIPSTWDYADTPTALEGLLSAGPAIRALDHSSREQVAAAVTKALQPFTQADGHVVFQNKFRVVLAQKP